MSQRNGLAGHVYDELKEKIMRNHIRPGEMLSEGLLSEQYHVSRTPIRQALQKLADRGLVQIRDGVGTYVTFIKPGDVMNAYEVRNALERIAAKTAVFRISAQELDALEKQFLLLQSQLTQGGYGASLDRITGADWALHDLIIERSENAFLPQMVDRVNMVLRRYQYVYVSTFERALREHLEIIRMMREKDLEGLDRILDQHIRFNPI